MACLEHSDCPSSQPACDVNVPACGPCNPAGDGDALCQARDAQRPFCSGAGGCVSCRSAADCTDPTRPLCDDGQCRGCREHGECASGACADDGSCLAPTQVLYVNRDRTGVPPLCGSSDNPCRTLAGAATLIQSGGPRTIVFLAGTDANPVAFDGALHGTQPIRIIGKAGAALRAINGPAVSVSAGAELRIDELRLSSVQADTPGAPPTHDAVRCDGPNSAIHLHRVTIEQAQVGVHASQCRLVTIERSRVFRSSQGGIRLLGSPFRITNNFIVNNGFKSVSETGGVRIESGDTALGTALLAFNTVRSNGSDAASASGIHCVTMTPATLSSNLLSGNEGGPATAGNCRHLYSAIPGSSGDGNIATPPLLTDDHHLQPGSPGIDVGQPGLVEVDIDGHGRPHGTGPDIGADEWQP